MTQSKPVLKERELRLRKLTCLVPVTDELLEDSAAMNAYLPRKIGDKISFALDDALIRGTGAGEPMGVLNSGALVTQAKATNQADDTIQAGNIFSMYSRMYAPWRSGAIWIINQDCEPQLFTMAIGSKTASGGDQTGGGPIYLPPGGTMANSPFGILLGRPVIPHQACETIGDLGDIFFVNWSQYMAAVKAGGLDLQRSIHLWFDQGTTAVRATFRADGQPAMASTISPRDGSNTMSAFVTLAARG